MEKIESPIHKIGDRAIPIAIISCQRPNYLYQTLKGIKKSCEYSQEKFSIALFQDQPPGDKQRSKAIAEECVKIFLETFPNGTFDLSDFNLGVAANFKRAEAWAFDRKINDSHLDAALFFEEDFVPNETAIPWILSLLDLSREIQTIGAVSAAGHLELNERDLLSPMGQLWAYGLRRCAFESILDKINVYDQLAIDEFNSNGCHHPPQDTCLKLATEWGYEAQACSRDSFIAMALHCHGYIQIAPNGVHGNYIGVNGLNMDDKQFASSEWSRANSDNTKPDIYRIKTECLALSKTFKDHQNLQFSKLNPEFYSDACATAYINKRYSSCIQIAERGLVLMGSQSCRGNQYCFERHRIKGLTGEGRIDEAIEYCDQLLSKDTGSWPLWALARGLEESNKLLYARRAWEYLIARYPEEGENIKQWLQV